jgi:hypothetical protein
MDKTSLCSLRWKHSIVNFGRSEVTTCCRTDRQKVTEQDLSELGIDVFLNSPYQMERRSEMIKGVRHSSCQSCWQLEDRGVVSPRTGAEEWNAYIQKHRGRSGHSNLLRSEEPELLEIMLSNTCNLKCTYCSHHYSSAWAAERIQFGEIPEHRLAEEFPKPLENFKEVFWQWYEKKAKQTVEYINILGGEPLIIPEFYDFIENLMKKTADVTDRRITLGVVTNLNTPPAYFQKFLQFLPRLTEQFSVELNISMESVEHRAEYIRSGLNWKLWERNLDEILKRRFENLKIQMIPTLNALSISSLNYFLPFLKSKYDQYQLPIGLRHNICLDPDWQSPFILTPDFASYVAKAGRYLDEVEPEVGRMQLKVGHWFMYRKFLQQVEDQILHGEAQIEQRKKFFRNFSEMDRRRKTNLIQTFPEYEGFWEICRRLDQPSQPPLPKPSRVQRLYGQMREILRGPS